MAGYSIKLLGRVYTGLNSFTDMAAYATAQFFIGDAGHVWSSVTAENTTIALRVPGLLVWIFRATLKGLFVNATWT